MKQTKVDTSLSLEDRKSFLEFCANKYETDGSSPIEDVDYDQEYSNICSIDPNFDIVGGMDEEHIHGTQVKHEHVFGSLLKDANISDFLVSLKSIYSGFNPKDLSFTIQHKLDGSAGGLKMKNGSLHQVVSRGKGGAIGVDITTNALKVEGVPKKIKYKGEVEVRGEFWTSREYFYENLVGEYSNPRNYVSGFLNRKTQKESDGECCLNFTAYETKGIEFGTEQDKLDFLVENGFHTLADTTEIVEGCHTFEEIAEKIKVIMESIDRPNLPYSIDGIVVKNSSIIEGEKLGYVSNGRKPKANRAVKFKTEKAITTLLDIERNMKKSGACSYVGLLEPVVLAETNVARVTLHNPRLIKAMGLKIGAKVILQKSGEIIPKLLSVVEDGHTEIEFDEACPSCGEKMYWTDVNLFCDNPLCPAQLVSSIDYFMKTLNVKGCGEKTIEKLTEEKNSFDDAMVSCISDMYNLRHFSSELQEELGPRAFEKLVKSIEEVKSVPLNVFVQALGISKIGSMAADITNIAPSVADIDKLTIGDVEGISGFGPTKSKLFVEGWKSMRDNGEIDKLLKYISIEEKEKVGDSLTGKTFCATGTLNNFSRKSVKEAIESNGGIAKSGVNAKLDYLICGENCGSKKTKAESNGYTKIITEEDFEEMIK